MRSLVLSLRTAALTFAVRAAGAAKEIVVAGLYGTGDSLDVFVGASALLVFAVNVTVSTLGLALIPRIAAVRQAKNEDAARKLTSVVLLWLTVVLSLLSIILWVLAPAAIGILCPGFNPLKAQSAVWAFRLLLPALPAAGWSALWGAILTLHGRYSIVALSPMISPVITLCLVAVFGSSHGPTPLVVGTLLGTLAEAGVLGTALRRIGHPITPARSFGGNPDLEQVIRQYAPMAIGAFLSGSSSLVDQIMISSLGPGSISALSYGSKITSMSLSVISTGLAMVLLPTYSDLAARGEWEALRRQHSAICRRLALTSVVAALLLGLFSPIIVRLLFERGAFRPTDTELVSRIQSMYALQLPFYLIGIITSRLLSALSANHILMAIGAVNLAVNIGGNFAFRAWLGAPGIALSSSLVQMISCILLTLIAAGLLRRAAKRAVGDVLH